MGETSKHAGQKSLFLITTKPSIFMGQADTQRFEYLKQRDRAIKSALSFDIAITLTQPGIDDDIPPDLRSANVHFQHLVRKRQEIVEALRKSQHSSHSESVADMLVHYNKAITDFLGL